MRVRSKDDLEFEDEIDYQPTESLRDKLKKYNGLKNFRTTEYNPYVFLFIFYYIYK